MTLERALMTSVTSDTLERVRAVRWHHSFEILPGIVTQGTYRPDGLWKRLALGPELSGKRVLDLGARDGYFSFQCEALGAEVLAVDYVDQEGTGFSLSSELRGSKVRFMNRNIYDLHPSEVGTFDYVLMLGLLYHLPDPYLALEILRSLVKRGGVAFIESTCIDDAVFMSDKSVLTHSVRDLPLMVYVARNATSFWDLNSACLRELLQSTGFSIVDMQRWGKRMLARAVAVESRVTEQKNSIARGVVKRG